MFRDASSVEPGAVLDAQVAIVGAGPAGISLSLALAKSGVSVLLIESGGERPTEESDLLNQGTSTVAGYPFMASRARALGGSTTRWYGACVELDPTDFQARDWVPFSGWPISIEHLNGYMAEARRFFGLSDTTPDHLQFETEAQFGPDLQVRAVCHSDPLDIGKAYQSALQGSKNILCLMQATVCKILQNEAGQVDHLDVRRPDGERFQVRATRFVLATGGLEIPRLLLASRDRDERGVGNEHDVVGRYHMEHPIRSVGVLPIKKQSAAARFLSDRHHVHDRAVEIKLGLSAAKRERLKLLDLHARFYRLHPLETDPAVAAAKRVLPALRGKESVGELRRYMKTHGFGSAAKLMRYGLWHFDNKVRAGASFDHLRLLAFLEQGPDPENRIVLSTRKDRFGTPLPHLVYRESAHFCDSVERSLEAIAQLLEEAGFGRLRTDRTTLDALRHYESYGFHPMGATRMSETPNMGVTDANLRIHGVPNLFAVGSSVFPTGGAANPTLTVVLLALRLADHLTRLIEARSVR